MFFFSKISETTRGSNFKIHYNVALDSLYILTGNDVIAYFWWAANCIKVFILGACLGRDFPITVQSISERFTVLEMVIQVVHPWFSNSLTFLLIDPENGAQVDQPSSAHYTIACFRFSPKQLKLPIHKFTQKASIFSPEMTSSATFGRLQIAFMPPLPSPTSPLQNGLLKNLKVRISRLRFSRFQRASRF